MLLPVDPPRMALYAFVEMFLLVDNLGPRMFHKQQLLVSGESSSLRGKQNAFIYLFIEVKLS